MRQVRKLEEADVDGAMVIMRDAYPAAGLPAPAEHRDALLRGIESSDTHTWGVWDRDRMVATLRTHDFMMTAWGQQIPVQGLGGVAVGLCDKKQKVARDLVLWFLEHSHQEGVGLTALYPFRTSFYQRMGWGLGAASHRFQLEPLSFPDLPHQGHVRFLNEGDVEALRACYGAVQGRTHGMFQVNERSVPNPKIGSAVRTVGVEFDGKLEAYMSFRFVAVTKANFLTHDLEVLSWNPESTRGLHGLCSFLRRQADQVRRVLLQTQDPFLQHLLLDPLDGSGNSYGLAQQISERGAGIMYRAIDCERFFDQLSGRNFGSVDMSCTVELQDGFWKRTNQSFELKIVGGKASMLPSLEGRTPDLSLTVGDFTSAVLGVLPIDRLVDYGRAQLNDPALQATLATAFHSAEAPRCVTQF